MPQRPDGKPASTERVTFTRQAAERIAKTVRTVEGGDRKVHAISFGNRSEGISGSKYRMAYYTATSDWLTIAFTASTSGSIASRKIQFAFPTSGTATAAAVNHFALLPTKSTATAHATRQIAVVREAGVWRVVASEC